MKGDGEQAGLLQDIGRKVRAGRKDRGLTLKQLAAASGISERFVSELEAGRANISVVNLWQVARSLEVPLAELVAGAASARPPREGVIALLGLRGAGKSSVGKALAAKLETSFQELDQLVEAEAGMGLAEIFAIHGEEYFRKVELQALKRYLDHHPRGVLATGGGLVASPDAWRLLRERTHTVWLKATPEDHWNRVVGQGDLRPMKDRPHAMAELRRRLKEREPLYARAERVCPTSGKPVAGVVAELERWSRG